MNAFPFLLAKEFKQMMRNIILPVVFVLLPLFMMNAVPRIATQEIKNLNIVLVDADHSPLSRRLIQKIAASAYFNLVGYGNSYREAEKFIKSGEADLIVEIAPDFERRLVRNEEAAIQVSANATNGTKSGLGSAYVSQIITSYALALREESGMRSTSDLRPPATATRFLYNQQLDYKLYMVPAIIAMILTLLMGFLPALKVVGEKEKGTIEQINVTPVSRIQFILSKLVPYWAFGVLILFYCIGLAYLFHGIWPAGSLWTILALTSVFVLVASSLGLVVSNYSSTLQQAALVMFFFLVIFILLSGLLTPVSSMPAWARAITELNPMRFFIEPLRIVYIKGVSVSELQPYFLRLLSMGIIASIWAVVSFSKNN